MRLRRRRKLHVCPTTALPAAKFGVSYRILDNGEVAFIFQTDSKQTFLWDVGGVEYKTRRGQLVIQFPSRIDVGDTYYCPVHEYRHPNDERGALQCSTIVGSWTVSLSR